MKNLTFLILAVFATLTTAFAEPGSDKDRFEKNYDYTDFTAVSVSHSFRVDLTFADRYEIYVDVPAYIEPYLRVNKSGNKVRIDLERLPMDIQNKLNKESDRLKARIVMPKMTGLQASGAVDIDAHGKLRLDDETLRIQLSGASKLNDLEAAGNAQLSLQLSGASTASVKAVFQKKTLIDLSGASKVAFEGGSEALSLECSGASKAQLKGNYDKVVADLSGSSVGNIEGNATDLSLEVSGASNFEIDGTTDNATVELSGVSKCRLAMTGKLQYEISGVSTLKVKDMGVSAKGDISRGSKFEYIR
ncbi:MAG: DUF2807 domain-containing protein [Bacteroidales bacterium]|nr:DUF2807 domain-containing protein [Bacteroidales bacterium]